MSDTSAQEPTMEEILASIRRIISEDEAPAGSEDAPLPAAAVSSLEVDYGAPPAPPPQAAPAYPETADDHAAGGGHMAAEDDVLELTNPLDVAPEHAPETAASSLGDLDVSTARTGPQLVATPGTGGKEDTLVSGSTAQTAASSFDQLTRSIALPQDGRTLEDVVTNLLKPLLKDWLDRNLASIVESKVQIEVERISRSRGF